MEFRDTLHEIVRALETHLKGIAWQDIEIEFCVMTCLQM